MEALRQSPRHSPRVKTRRAGEPVPDGRCVLYWMQRAQRAEDNPALDIAVEAANALSLPLVVFVAIDPDFPCASWRHLAFCTDGLPDLAEALAARNVGFVLRRAPDHSLPKLIDELKPALLIGDEHWLRETEAARLKLAEAVRLPFWTVDADVIVPTQLLQKEQFSARVIRPRIHARLAEFLQPSTEPKARIAWKRPKGLFALDPRDPPLEGLTLDRTLSPVKLRGGTRAAKAALADFIDERLGGYAGRARARAEGRRSCRPICTSATRAAADRAGDQASAGVAAATGTHTSSS